MVTGLLHWAGDKVLTSGHSILLHWAGGQGTDQWSQDCYIGLGDKVLTSGHMTATLGWGTRY